jgi:hypothetical protein
MAYCTRCGTKWPEDVHFCGKCGIPILSEPDEGPEERGNTSTFQQGNPPQDYAPSPPYQQFPPGNGPIPTDRRNGWKMWFSYISIFVLGTIIGLWLTEEAYKKDNTDGCTTVSYNWEYDGEVFYEEYEDCSPNADYLHMANMVHVGSVIAGLAISIRWLYSMYSEFNTYMQGKVLDPFLAACVPILNIYAFYLFCDKLNKEATKRGRPGFIEPGVTCCLAMIVGIGWPIYQGKLNEFWDLVAYQQQH